MSSSENIAFRRATLRASWGGTFASTSSGTAVVGTDANGVAAKHARSERIRARLSHFYFKDRVAPVTPAELAAAHAHGEHEARNGGEYDQQWPAWYAAYMVAEQAGTELPR